MTIQPVNLPPPIDFTRVPADAVVALLRALGEQLLQAAVTRQCAPLGRWIGNDNARWLLSGQVGLFDPLKQQLARLRFGRNRPPSTFRGAASAAREGTVTEAAWRLGVTSELRRRFRVDGPEVIPPDLWPAIGLRAFGGLEFCRAASEHAELLVRRGVLMDLRGFPTVEFHPQTFWLLLHLATTGQNLQRKLGPFPGRNRLVRQFRLYRARWRNYREQRSQAFAAARLLAGYGAALGLGDFRWANEWDQWLLLEATRTWGRAGDRDVAAAIARLPLARALPVGPAPAAQRTEPLNANEEFLLPPWFMGWLESRA